MAGKAKELTPDEARDKQRADDRAAELEKQAEVDAAMAEFLEQSEADAKKAQDYYVTHGVRMVDNA